MGGIPEGRSTLIAGKSGTGKTVVGLQIASNLARHGIDVVLDKVDADGRRIGEVLEAYTVSHQVDVLAMGAYGHARWREFILGGATKSLLAKPPLPILFSH